MLDGGYSLSESQRRKPGVVVFDVEGVLVPKKRFLYFALGRNLRFSQFLRIVFYGFLYEIGIFSLKTALSHVFKVFRGMSTKELLSIFKQVPLTPQTKQVFEELRSGGWKTALISSGLPAIVVIELASRLEADYGFGIELKTQNDVLTGGISGEVIEKKGKLRVLRRILAIEELLVEDFVVIADDRNNLSIFLPEALKIGFNPDFAIRVKADSVITGDLPEILPLIRGGSKQTKQVLTRNQIVREAMHASGCFVPVIAAVAGIFPVALSISAITILYAISETGRMERRSLPVIAPITRFAATQQELYEFATAPIFFAFGILFSLLLFPLPLSGAAIAAFALGDSISSLFGRRYGKRTLPFNKGKTLEGSVSGFLVAFFAAAYFVPPAFALQAAATAIIVESLPLPLSDNLLVPLVTGIVLILA
jgi:dolichol kinase/phosphoserine phosphatase